MKPCNAYTAAAVKEYDPLWVIFFGRGSAAVTKDTIGVTRLLGAWLHRESNSWLSNAESGKGLPSTAREATSTPANSFMLAFRVSDTTLSRRASIFLRSLPPLSHGRSSETQDLLLLFFSYSLRYCIGLARFRIRSTSYDIADFLFVQQYSSQYL